jgi:DNA-binding PadR family transcriptional regulator
MSKDFMGFAGFPGGKPWGVAFGLGGGRGARFFEAGEVRMAMLSLLSEGPKHGYQLMKEMTERSGGTYKASAGSVYPTLQQMEDEQLISCVPRGGRRIYSLTAAGRRELKSDPETVRRIWERAEECGDWGRFMTPEHGYILQSIGALAKASLNASQSAGTARVAAILDRARKQLEEL